MQDNNIIQNAIDYIKKLNKKNTELKAENARLKSCLQEIKAIAESAMAKQQEYKKDYEQILELITKAESEG